ncbi:hypothetical protein JCM10213v2_003759 [Rhodosporidiobolus nylandii]
MAGRPPLPVVSPGDPDYGTVVSATAFYPRCIQQASTKATSEDCLRINIYRPQGTKNDAGLPVMVYIFGGSFYSGGANGYSPTNLVLRSQAIGKPTIVCTIDYRLGFLGFGASDALREAGLLNLGLHDQRQALRWVSENIQAFGGDPSKVLLFGQSAGAIAVSYQMLAYGGNLTELVRGAIMESGAPGTAFAFDHTSSFPAFSYPDEPMKNNLVLSKASCLSSADELACLRSATTSQILSGQANVRAYGGFPYAPVIDGEFLTDVPSKLLAAGNSTKDPTSWVWANANAETPEQIALKNAMSDAWINFANDLDPNGPTVGAYWPQYLQSNLTQIQFKFGEQDLIPDTYRATAISYINSHPEIFGQ